MPSYAKKEKKDKHKKKQKHYSGTYNGIEYFSCLELATIIFCEESGRKIKSCNIGPIHYFDTKKNKIRKYFPDFIVDDFLILEVKWLGFIYEKKKEEILAKKKSLEEFCEKNDFWCLFVTNNLIKKKYIEKAKRTHNERANGIKKNILTQRKNSLRRRGH